ncbi:1-aminocyclopropane-1-carboxylate oxidase homolog 11 [Linum grandiflorum]
MEKLNGGITSSTAMNSDTLLLPSPISYDRNADIKTFDDTKAGVKGLVDSGVTTIPRLFIHHHTPEDDDVVLDANVPLIDLSSSEEEVVKQIREAAETWGFFLIVNHGMAPEVMDGLLADSRRFHELPGEEKMQFYSRDATMPVRYVSNGTLLTRTTGAADWRDTLAVNAPDGQLDPQFCPSVCRKAVTEYLKQVTTLKNKLSGLLSKAAGLSENYLSSIKCMESISMACHYYPSCPQPGLTLGVSKHTDPYLLTILLQDSTGGLQVLNPNNQWVDVCATRGTLLITNDKFKSVEHRVKSWSSKIRSSVACFFSPSSDNLYTPYSPANEIISKENPLVYRPTHVAEFIKCFRSHGSSLSHFRFLA